MHPLVRLNRSYCAGDISLESVFEYLRQSAPSLFIEVAEAPEQHEETKPIKPESVIDIGFDDSPEPSTPIPEQIAEKPSTPQTEEQAEAIKKTEWMNSKTRKSHPYDDFGNLQPLD
jgi:hypothetical protein